MYGQLVFSLEDDVMINESQHGLSYIGRGRNLPHWDLNSRPRERQAGALQMHYGQYRTILQAITGCVDLHSVLRASVYPSALILMYTYVFIVLPRNNSMEILGTMSKTPSKIFSRCCSQNVQSNEFEKIMYFCTGMVTHVDLCACFFEH